MPSCERVNLILFHAAELAESGARGRLVLADRRGRHVCRVLRARPGDRVRVGMIHGPTGTGEVLSADRDRVELDLVLTGEAPAPPPVDLVLAVPRPKAVARVVQSAAALGVRRIDLVNAWRVDKSYLGSNQLEPGALREHALLGCEQGAHTWVPEVAVHRLLMPFVREHLAPRMSDMDHALLAHPHARTLLEAVVQPAAAETPGVSAETPGVPAETPGASGRTIVAIGPEGGWIEREIESFVALGFVPVACLDSVLRVEPAVVAVLAQLALLRRLGARSA